MKHKLSVFEQMRKKDEILINQYLGAITWERIFFIWNETLESFGVDKDNIFLEIESNNSKLSCGVIYFSWWEKNHIDQSKKSLLEVINSMQLSTVFKKPIFDQRFKAAELDTLDKLWEFRHEPEKIAVLLLHASLFTRISGGAQFPTEYWPPYIVVESLSEMIGQILNSDIPLWHHACRRVMPTFTIDRKLTVKNITGLIHYLAIEHCKLLSKYQPVRIYNVTS